MLRTIFYSQSHVPIEEAEQIDDDRSAAHDRIYQSKGRRGQDDRAANIGAAIAQAGKKVCMIDLDPQAHLTLHLGVG